MTTTARMRAFVALADTGSVRGAAAKMVVTESTVSAAVRALAEEVGVPLVERDGRGVRLTRAGHRYAGYARRILGLHAEASVAARGEADPERGRVRLGAVTTAGEHLLPGILASFRARYPGVALGADVAPSAAVWPMLDHHEVDVVVAGRPPPGSAARVRAMRENALTVVGSPELEPGFDPATATWLLREHGSGTRATLSTLLDDLQIDPPSSSAGTRGTRAYLCVPDQLRGLLTFSDGTVNDFTGRITWSSDNPAVVSVGANTGILAPQAPGSATITASYFSLQASIKVEVGALANTDLSLQKLDQQSYSPIGSGGFTIATNTAVAGRGSAPATQNVVVVATERAAATSASVKRNVTGSTTFALTDSTGATVPATTVATSQTATVYALTAGSAPSPGPYTLTATLGACSSPLTLSVPLNVANVSSLTLQP
ncbi:MAG: LysR family transcriptional regulator, partial [Pseudonocardia sp.]|nr:LysR family transcriptional regulator [Pseudonocardia sp.]